MSLTEFRRKRGGIEFYGEMIARQEAEKTAFIYDFSAERQDVIPDPPPYTGSGLPHGCPDLRGIKYGGLTVLKYVGKGRWDVVCMCGTKEVRTTRAVRNPCNTFDACVECRKPIGRLRSDFLKSTGKDVPWEVCFQYLYG